MTKIYKIGRFIGSEWIGWNSVTVWDWDFVSKVGGYMVKATAWVDIEWVAAGEQTFASDNQTVAMSKMSYLKSDDYSRYRVAISWGTITQADEWKYYDLTDADTVDWTSESTTTGQVKLEKFETATQWIFSIANK